MKIIELIKLKHRANKYKNRDDKGGIYYINSKIQKGDIVFDIGAHKAGYLYFMQKLVGKSGKVFAFEPQLNLYHYIQKIKTQFSWENVTIEKLALSDKTSVATLYIPKNKVSKGSSPGATIVKQTKPENFTLQQEVSTETLDNYCTRNKIQPDLLKIDVEGNELSLLYGAIETLKKNKPKIIVEIESRHVGEEKVLETFKFLESLGYTGRFVHDLEYIPLKNFSFKKYQDLTDMKNYCNNFIFE